MTILLVRFKTPGARQVRPRNVLPRSIPPAEALPAIPEAQPIPEAPAIPEAQAIPEVPAIPAASAIPAGRRSAPPTPTWADDGRVDPRLPGEPKAKIPKSSEL